jgi:hypothetical protein
MCCVKWGFVLAAIGQVADDLHDEGARRPLEDLMGDKHMPRGK